MKDKFKRMMNSNRELEDMKEKRQKRFEQSEKGINAYTVFLSVMCLVIAVLFFVYKDLWFGLGFLGLAALLFLMAFFSYRSEKKAAQKSKDKKDRNKR